jgi:hypothetical protein
MITAMKNDTRLALNSIFYVLLTTVSLYRMLWKILYFNAFTIDVRNLECGHTMVKIIK